MQRVVSDKPPEYPDNENHTFKVPLNALIFILIYFEWHNTENQYLQHSLWKREVKRKVKRIFKQVFSTWNESLKYPDSFFYQDNMVVASLNA